MILAIDTSAGTSVAVVATAASANVTAAGSGGVLAERSTDDTMRHAEVIGQFIVDVLAEASVTAHDITAVAVGMGPGPFTGLRVGIAAARAFAIGRNFRVLPIVSHDAIAFERYSSGGSGAVRPMLVVTDARRRELYWAAYDGIDDAGLPIRVDGPGLSKPDSLPHPEYARVDAAQVSAGSLGRLAALLELHDRPFAADEPLYLRSPDVTMSTRKRVS